MAQPAPRPAAGGPAPEQLERLQRLLEADHQAAFVTTRPNGTSQASLVRAGLLAHPVTGAPAVVVLVRGGTVKLRNLRRIPRATVLCRAGSRWATVEGPVTLIGPDDPHEGIDRARFEALRRAAATAVARSDESWEAFDHLMDAERRALVFVTIERLYGS